MRTFCPSIHPSCGSVCVKAVSRLCPSASLAGQGMSTPMRRMRSDCCARAVNGHAAAEPQTTFKNSRRLIDTPEAKNRPSYRLKPAYWKGPNVRFGSYADMCSAQAHVRLTPNSDRVSGPRQTVMSALPPKADMCGAIWDVRFGPIADIAHSFDYIVGAKKYLTGDG